MSKDSENEKLEISSMELAAEASQFAMQAALCKPEIKAMNQQYFLADKLQQLLPRAFHTSLNPKPYSPLTRTRKNATTHNWTSATKPQTFPANMAMGMRMLTANIPGMLKLTSWLRADQRKLVAGFAPHHAAKSCMHRTQHQVRVAAPGALEDVGHRLPFEG